MDTCTLVIPDLTMAEEIRAYRQAFLSSGDSMDGTGNLRRYENPEDWIVGMIQVRHEFNDYLERYGGHIGYSVRPDERRKGYASAMQRAALPVCRALGLERVLVICLTDNEGSRRTILRNGGVYECTVHEPEENEDLERYWIAL